MEGGGLASLAVLTSHVSSLCSLSYSPLAGLAYIWLEGIVARNI